MYKIKGEEKVEGDQLHMLVCMHQTGIIVKSGDISTSRGPFWSMCRL